MFNVICISFSAWFTNLELRRFSFCSRKAFWWAQSAADNSLPALEAFLLPSAPYLAVNLCPIWSSLICSPPALASEAALDCSSEGVSRDSAAWLPTGRTWLVFAFADPGAGATISIWLVTGPPRRSTLPLAVWYPVDFEGLLSMSPNYKCTTAISSSSTWSDFSCPYNRAASLSSSSLASLTWLSIFSWSRSAAAKSFFLPSFLSGDSYGNF